MWYIPDEKKFGIRYSWRTAAAVWEISYWHVSDQDNNHLLRNRTAVTRVTW